MTDKSPREWWISLPNTHSDGLILEGSFELFDGWEPENNGYIRVIEKSAYLAVVKFGEQALQTATDNKRMIDELLKERDRDQAALHNIENLRLGKTPDDMHIGDRLRMISREALNGKEEKTE